MNARSRTVMALAALAGLPAMEVAAGDLCQARSGAQVMPLVELYTSEGCSSCPPADRWLTRQVSGGVFKANWLAFHVDYWDDLGWPDRFAMPAYSQRQRERVRAAGESTVYTPQVMIGDEVRTSWHNDAAVAEALNDASRRAQVGLAMRVQHDGKAHRVLLGAAKSIEANTPGAQVWLAQTMDGQQTNVRAGENDGVLLRHDRVVTKLWGPWPLGKVALSKTMTLELPAANWGLTAFVQGRRGQILQSLGLGVESCR